MKNNKNSNTRQTNYVFDGTVFVSPGSSVYKSVHRPSIQLGDKLEVYWLDSAHSRGWQDREDANKEIDKTMKCRSCGYLFAATEDRLVLAQSHAYEESEEPLVGEMLTIPRVAITKIIRLTED